MKKLLILLISSTTLFVSCNEDDDTGPDQGETPVVSAADFEASIQENPNAGATIGTVSATTSQGALTYELVSQSVENAIEINSETGELTVNDPTAFVTESNPQITGVYAAVVDDVREEANITITVTTDAVFNIWTGSTITFTKREGSDPSQEANQDRITSNVWITRGNEGGQIYNASSESQASKNSSPAGTEWAAGSVEDIGSLTFRPFRDAVGNPKLSVGTELVLHLIEDDIYMSVTFTSWSQGKAGGFAYERPGSPD